MVFNFWERKNTSIDLLPESVQKRKGFRKLVIRLAAAQVAIFLCLAAAVVGINVLERQAWDESHELTIHVNALRHGAAVEAAAYARELSLRIAAEDSFVEAHAPADFDPVWVTAIMQTSGGHMTAFYYSGAAILVTGMIGDMNAIEAHRQSILDTEVFTQVDLGRIILQECGQYFYELWVRLR